VWSSGGNSLLLSWRCLVLNPRSAGPVPVAASVTQEYVNGALLFLNAFILFEVVNHFGVVVVTRSISKAWLVNLISVIDYRIVRQRNISVAYARRSASTMVF
jgi:hypothetical protein